LIFWVSEFRLIEIPLLHQSGEITPESYQSIKPDIQELLKLLVSIVKTSKERSAL
jgi:hypothetical protein